MPKRTGAPYYRKDRQAWYLKITLASGKRSELKLGDTRTEAFEEYERLMTEAKNRRNAGLGQEVLFESVVEKWLERQETRLDQKEITEKWLARAFRTVTAFKAAHPAIVVSEMTPAKVQAWLKKPSANYERTELGLLRQVLKWAKTQARMIDDNPLEALELPEMTSREGTVSDADHAKAIACRAARHIRPLLEVAMLTGCRPGELRALRWDHITEDGKMAILPPREHKTGKKTKAPRKLIFPQAAQRILSKQKKVCDHVFLNSRGRPWTSNAVVQAMDAIHDETGIKITAGMYRHTFATNALEKEVPVATVSALLGHTSTQMVSRVYSKLRDRTDHLSDAVEKATAEKVTDPQLKIHKPA